MKFTFDLQVAKGAFLRIVFPVSLLVFVLLAAIAPASAQSRADSDSGGNPTSIEGSWLFSIDIFVAQQPVAAFNSLISFAGGG
jgi:hypothetical protein